MATHQLPTMLFAPPNSVDLDDDIFLVVQRFNSTVLVHVRQYEKKNFQYVPTTFGVTMSPDAWENFVEERRSIENGLKQEQNGTLFKFKNLSIGYFKPATGEPMVQFIKGDQCMVITQTQFELILEKIEHISNMYVMLSSKN